MKKYFLSEKELKFSKNYIRANGLTYNKRYRIRKRNEKRMKEIIQKAIKCFLK